MAGKINKVTKGIATFTVLLLVFILSVLASAFISGGLLALFSACWTIFNPLPELLCTKFYLVYALSVIPSWLILVVVIATSSSEKKDNKSNRN